MNNATPNIKTFYKGQTIFKEGQESTVAYMIRKGAVNIYKIINNKKVILDRLGEGEIFGEMGIIIKGARTADAEAAEYCEVLVLTKQVMENLLASSPKTIQFLTKALIRRLKRTTQMVPDRDYRSSFVSVCNILDLLYHNHLQVPAKDRKKIPNYDLGMGYKMVSKRIKSIILVSQLEIDHILKKLANLKVIEITTLKSKRAFAERYVKLSDPATFLEVSSNLYKELKKSEFTMSTELEYIDLYEFAEDVGATPEILYKKICAHEIPESLFFLHRPRAAEWAAEMGTDYFKTVKRRRKSVDELEEVDDVIFVDNATLKKVFENLGYYKVGVLLGLAGDEAREKILRNLSAKIAKIVEEEAANRGYLDEAEAEDIQMELIEAIRDLKGAGK